MYWELWDTGSGNLVETFTSEAEALAGVRELLAINDPDFADDLSLSAMYDASESRELALPPSLTGASLLSWVRPVPAAATSVAAPAAAGHLGDLMRIWLQQEGCTVEARSDPDVDFSLVARWPSGEMLSVVRPTAQPDRVYVVTSLVFDRKASATFADLPSERQAAVLWALRLELVRMGVDFGGVDPPLRRIFIGHSTYVEDLTRATFMDRFDRVRRALLAARWVYQQATEATLADRTAPSSSSAPPVGYQPDIPAWAELALQGMEAHLN